MDVETPSQFNQCTILDDICQEWFNGNWNDFIHHLLQNMSPKQFDRIKEIYKQFNYDKG